MAPKSTRYASNLATQSTPAIAPDAATEQTTTFQATSSASTPLGPEKGSKEPKHKLILSEEAFRDILDMAKAGVDGHKIASRMAQEGKKDGAEDEETEESD